MDRIQKIWNRAALNGTTYELKEGDLALAAVLRAHGMVMNGGVLHAIEDLSKPELDAAIKGYRFFSLPSAADLFERVLSGDRAPCADSEYANIIPNDGAIEERFLTVFHSDPEKFAEI